MFQTPGSRARPKYKILQSRKLLNTLTANNSPTLFDLTSFLSGFIGYELVFENLIPATTNVSSQIQVHSGGIFQTTGYLANEMHFIGSIATTAFTTLIPPSSSSILNSAPGLGAIFRVFNPSLTSTPKNWIGTFSYASTVPGNVGGIGTGYWNSNGAVDGFQFLFSAGNITSGVIRVYGLS